MKKSVFSKLILLVMIAAFLVSFNTSIKANDNVSLINKKVCVCMLIAPMVKCITCKDCSHKENASFWERIIGSIPFFGGSIVEWLNNNYECPKCGKKNWVVEYWPINPFLM